MARQQAQDQPPTEPATNAAALLAALASASQQDLEELDRQIEAVTRELADATVGFRKKLNALQEARRLVALSLNGAPTRQARGARKPNTSPPERVVTTGRVVADELIEDDEPGDTPSPARESQDKVEVRVRDLLREEGGHAGQDDRGSARYPAHHDLQCRESLRLVSAFGGPAAPQGPGLTAICHLPAGPI